MLDGEPRTIVGVMPPSFDYPRECEVWTAARYRVPEHALRPDLDQSAIRDSHYFFTIGRLRPGVARAQAQAEADTIVARLAKQYKDEETNQAAVVSLQDDLVGHTRPALLVLLAAVALLLAIACANVANILLARGATRQKEMTIRGALGAGRARLIRQMLTESAILGAIGGGLGIALAYASMPALRALVPTEMTGGASIALDARVLAFTALVSLGSAILFGVYPARQAARFELNAVLQESGRGTAGARRSERVRRILAAAEVSLAAVLLIGAGLLIRSFDGLLRAPEGFRPDHVLSLRLSLPLARYLQPADRVRFVDETLTRLQALPGIRSAAAISRLPLNPGNSTRSVDIKGRTLPPDEIAPDYLVVTPNYFHAMGIRILQGRPFTERDGAHSAPVVIVNEAMVRHFWPHENPLDQFVQLGGCGNEHDWCQVVGVVDDVRQHDLGETTRPAVFVPYARDPWPFMAVVVRTATEPGAAASEVRAAIHDVDKDQPVYAVRTMDQVISESLVPRKAATLLFGLFAFLALALASAGIYGVIAYSTAQRAHEIGIRMALGAGRSQVLGLVVGQALKLALAGIVAGAFLAFVLTRFLSHLLYGVGASDPLTFTAASFVLVTMTGLASYLPARRATRMDPVKALRS